MSPLGQAISDWLKTGPGPFQADTADEAVEKARQEFGPKKAEFAVFKQYLDMMGYRPQQRMHHGPNTVYYMLALPEHFVR